MSVTPEQRRGLRNDVISAIADRSSWAICYALDVPDLLDALEEAERRAETAERRLAAHSAPVEEAIEE